MKINFKFNNKNIGYMRNITVPRVNEIIVIDDIKYNIENVIYKTVLERDKYNVNCFVNKISEIDLILVKTKEIKERKYSGTAPIINPHSEVYNIPPANFSAPPAPQKLK